MLDFRGLRRRDSMISLASLEDGGEEEDVFFDVWKSGSY